MPPPISRGFRRRHAADAEQADRVPPGQYVVTDFPVLSAGPTPHTPLEEWSLEISGEIDAPRRWPWEEFRALPTETFATDIHCVTKWSKLGTSWTGVSVDTLLDGVETEAEFVLAVCDGGYDTNLPLDDVTRGKARVAFDFPGVTLEPPHGRPPRLLLPPPSFWERPQTIRPPRL